MFNKSEIVPKSTDTMTFYDSAFMSIKSYLCDIANSYLNIAYKVYELDVRIRKDGKKCKYKNVVEACEIELGFKKSTTYNMLNIVKTYAVDDKGKISYQQLCTHSHYTYSQLVEMLSLGSEQRADITPDTSVSAIRMLKKSNEKEKPETFQTSGKSPEPSQSFQTSGKTSAVPELSESVETSVFSVDSFEVKIVFEDNDLFMEFNHKFSDYIDDFVTLLSDFNLDISSYAYDPRSYLSSDEIEKYSPDDLEERFNVIMALYRQAYNSYYKQLNRHDKSAV